MYRFGTLTSNAAIELFADPIIRREGGVVAVAVRTECASPGRPLGYRRSRSKWEKRKLLKEQLQLIKKKSDYFLTSSILCSIPIDFDVSDLLLEDAGIFALAKSMPFLRLEVYEDFPNLSDGKSNRLIQMLSSEYHLWLGDLGTGGANLRALQEKLYDGVRINRDFVNLYSKSIIWPVIIKNLMRYCNFIIVDDVSHKELTHSIEKIGAIYGLYFTSSPLKEVEKLNRSFDI